MHWRLTRSSRVPPLPPPAGAFSRAATPRKRTRRGAPRAWAGSRSTAWGRPGPATTARAIRPRWRGSARPPIGGCGSSGGVGRPLTRGEAAMALTATSICNFGWKARDFQLKGVDGKVYTLDDVRGPKGTLVVFICNHCPYVRAVIRRLVEEANALKAIGIGTIAIMPND